MPRAWLIAALLLAPLASGCQWVPKSQLSASENRNRDLVEETRALRAELEHQGSHRHALEDRLAAAETDLAMIARRAGLDRTQLAQLRGGRGLIPGGVSQQLADLATRYPALNFDPATGVSKLSTDVLFDTGEAELRPEGRRMLDEFADVLSTPEAKPLRLMLVGHADDRPVAKQPTRERYGDNWNLSTARAQAVNDYLRQRGIGEERMGVAGFADNQPIAHTRSPADRELNRRVEIFVIAPETPMVGWVDSLAPLYR